MRTILGFYRIPSLANNNVGAVATFGEIDRQRMTYTTEERNFKYTDEYPNVELVTLQVADELSQPVNTGEAIMEKIVAVGEWLYGQHIEGLIPTNSSKAAFYAALEVEFADLQWLSMGDLERSAENSFYMPTHVEFTYTSGGYEYYVKVWLSAERLQEEYEPYKLYIIPPVDELSQFINNTVTLIGILAANTPDKVLSKYNALRQNNPETLFDSFNLTWHDPEDSESTLVTQWAYIAYGINGTFIDNIKTGIRDYLAGNSDYEEWDKIFPSLYEETDFTIIPLWGNIAVPETQIDLNLYSSYTAISNLAEIAEEVVPSSYGTSSVVATHIGNHMELFSTFYRGMILGVVANPNNINDTVRMSYLYPDYSSTPTTDPDFERMSPDTQEFVEKLNEGLEIARTLDESDTIGGGFYRTRRSNLVYVTFLHGDFQHMILTRESYKAKLGISLDPVEPPSAG